MVNSMTGFASLKGSEEGARWSWEIRSVNARGLDLRLRLPEGLDDLEQVVRKALSEYLARGNVTLGLRLQCEAEAGGARLNGEYLGQVLAAVKSIENEAEEQGVHMTASSAADILAIRGVLDVAENSENSQKAVVAALKKQIKPLVSSFCDARAAEGCALLRILTDQLEQIKTLVSQARQAIGDRHKRMASNLKQNLTLILESSDGVDEGRLTQELAVLAVKADVAEELDRLDAHIEAASGLLGSDGPVGRKFDFLMQEFNREANTLCSKSGSTELTRIGLDLKTVIDQMREQVQNVE